MFDRLIQISKDIRTCMVYDVDANKDISRITSLVKESFKLLDIKGKPNLSFEANGLTKAVKALDENSTLALKCISIMDNYRKKL